MLFLYSNLSVAIILGFFSYCFQSVLCREMLDEKEQVAYKHFLHYKF